jgi:anaerobic selenocysteine-containing dehydrogenase
MIVHGFFGKEEVSVMAQQAGSQSRREFLKTLTLAGAAGVLGVHSHLVAAAEEKHPGMQSDKPSALDVCRQRDADAHNTCPNCCNDRYGAI